MKLKKEEALETLRSRVKQGAKTTLASIYKENEIRQKYFF